MVIEEIVENQEPVVEIRACSECFTPMECRVVEVFGRRLNFEVLCEPCAEKKRLECEAEEARLCAERLLKRFESLCPPLYRSSDPQRIPAAFLREIEAWQVSPRGLGFVAVAGRGKTRAAWMLLRRLHFTGHRVHGITATQFAKASADQWHDDPAVKAAALSRMEACRGAEVLLLDDLGKQKFTERAETELFDLLEHRTSHELPIVWTANAGKDELKKMLSPDRGEPILRRLVEFSKVVGEEAA